MNTKMDDLKIKIGLIICQTKMKYENSKNSYKVQNCTFRTESYIFVQNRTFCMIVYEMVILLI